MYSWFRVGKGRRLHAFYVRRHDDVSRIAACGVGPRDTYITLLHCVNCDRIVNREMAHAA